MKNSHHFLNSFHLKIIGLISMIFDHIIVVFEMVDKIDLVPLFSINLIVIFRIIGRFSFIIFSISILSIATCLPFASVYPLYNLFTQLSSVTENLVKVGAVIYQAFRNIFRQTLTNREIKPSIKRYMTRLSRVIYLLVREYEKSFSYSLFKPFLLVTEQSTDLFRPTSFKRASPPFHLKF